MYGRVGRRKRGEMVCKELGKGDKVYIRCKEGGNRRKFGKSFGRCERIEEGDVMKG